MWPPASRAVYAAGGNAMFVVLLSTWMRAFFLLFAGLVVDARPFPSRMVWRPAATGGIFQAVSILTMVGSLVYLPGPVAIVIAFSHTIMLLFFMAWRGEATLDAATVTTTFCALLGLAFAVDFWHQHVAGQWLGIGLAFASALATLSRLYVYGRQLRERPPVAVGAENFIFAALFVTAAALVWQPHAPAGIAGWGWGALAGASLSLGTLGMFYGIAHLGSFQWSLFSKLEPIFTAFFSVLFLGEVLSVQRYLGIFLVVGSLVVYQVLTVRRKPAAAG